MLSPLKHLKSLDPFCRVNIKPPVIIPIPIPPPPNVALFRHRHRCEERVLQIFPSERGSGVKRRTQQVGLGVTPVHQQVHFHCNHLALQTNNSDPPGFANVAICKF